VILSTQLRITRQEYKMLAGSPDYYNFKMDNQDLGYVESDNLDIDTTHKSDKGLAIVEWRPWKVFTDPMEFIQHREQNTNEGLSFFLDGMI
jgi:hypothetical protein